MTGGGDTLCRPLSMGHLVIIHLEGSTMIHAKNVLFGLMLASFGIVGMTAMSAPAHAEMKVITCTPETSCLWATGCGTYLVCSDGSVWKQVS